MRTVSAIVVALLLASASDAWGDATVPSLLTERSALLTGEKAGVDRDHNLWFWNGSQRTVTSIAATGEVLSSPRLLGVTRLDVDARRGIAALVEDGRRVQVFAWDGRVLHDFNLPDAAGDIAWATGPLVAVTPQRSDHRIAIWDVATGTLVKTIGEAIPIARGPGEHLGRATLLRYSFERDELIALDATFGRVFVFDASGREVRAVRLPEMQTPIHEWLNNEGDERGESRLVLLWRYRSLALGPEGSMWISADRQPDGRVKLYEYRTDNVLRTVLVEGPACLASRPVIWRNVLILIADSDAGYETCGTAIGYSTARTAKTPVAERLGDVRPASSRLRTPPKVASNATCPPIVGLGVPITGQHTEVWCWAASGEMTMNFLGGNVTQCDQANKRFGRTDCCCGPPTPEACVNTGWPEYEKYGFTVSVSNGALSWSELTDQIGCQGKPFAFSWWWNGGGGHMMVATGYYQSLSGGYVQINDPLPWDPSGGGSQRMSTYDAFVSGPGYTHALDYYDITKQ
jgi:Peptidase_C39 like family